MRWLLRKLIRITVMVVIGLVGLMILGLYVGSQSGSSTSNTATSVSQNQAAVPKSDATKAIEASIPKKEPLELIGQAKGLVDEMGFTTVTGRVRNNTTRSYKYAQITFIVTNKAGDQIGTAMANINGLEPGATWAFKAVCLSAGGSKYRLGEITGW